MTTERLLIAAAFSALVLGTQAYAAPGGGNQGGGQAGGKPKMEQPAKSMDRTETQAREQKELHNPGTGEQTRERTEATVQNRDQVQDQAKGQGQATSQQMQERQEQRKQIQEETRSTQSKGEHAGKKPWWKFWESDDNA